MTLAENHSTGALFHLGKVLQVHAIEAACKGSDDVDWFFARADEVSEVGASTDARIAAFDGPEHIDDFIETVGGAVVVDRDSDVVLFDEFIEAIHRIGGGCGRDVLHASLFGEFEHLAIGFGIFSKTIDSMG